MKLSEKLREKRDTAKRRNSDPDYERHHSTVPAAYEKAAQLAEVYEAEVEKRAATIEAKVEKRIAELTLELCTVRGARDDAYAALDNRNMRVAELEAWQNAFLEWQDTAAKLIESMQKQLAWTPVADGLPTEPGWYEVASTRKQAVDVFQLIQMKDGLWWWLRDVRYESPLERYPSADIFRRIELPEAT